MSRDIHMTHLTIEALQTNRCSGRGNKYRRGQIFLPVVRRKLFSFLLRNCRGSGNTTWRKHTRGLSVFGQVLQGADDVEPGIAHLLLDLLTVIESVLDT